MSFGFSLPVGVGGLGAAGVLDLTDRANARDENVVRAAEGAGGSLAARMPFAVELVSVCQSAATFKMNAWAYLVRQAHYALSLMLYGARFYFVWSTSQAALALMQLISII